MTASPAVEENGPVGRNVALPLLPRDVPGLAERVPQLALLRGQAVDEELNGLGGHQRRHDLGPEGIKLFTAGIYECCGANEGISASLANASVAMF
jgi:hypothetical protein